MIESAIISTGGISMKKRIFALIMGTTLALAACNGGGDNAQEPAKDNNAGGGAATADAEKLVEQNCISCHGKNLEGGVGPNLQKVGSKLSQEEIENIILNGQGSMPKGLLQGDDAKAVAAWLAEKK
jgi:cytochrome c551